MQFERSKTPASTVSLILMTGIAAMTMHLFVPSLPAMAKHFETDYRVMQLSVAVFLALNGVLQLFIGPLSDRYGRRPVLLAGFWIFIFATIGCLLATDVVTFLIFRSAQAGIVVALVLGRAMIRDIYEKDQAASMIGYVTTGMAVVPLIAPAVGGVLDELFGWQANFWLFLAAGIFVLALGWIDAGETHHDRSTSLTAQFKDYPELLRSPRFWG